MENSGLFSVAKIILSKIIEKPINFEEALAETKEQLLSIPTDFAVADNIILQLRREHQTDVDKYTKLIELNASDAKDFKTKTWYHGITLENGIWQSLKTKMENGDLADAVDAIDKSSGNIVGRMAEFRVDQDKRLGLVVGNVQSGKTANYAAVIAKALDAGYKMVIVLSGIHNNLRRQTQQRLEKDLGIRDVEQRSKWYSLTDLDSDLAPNHAANFHTVISGEAKVFGVVKKNKSRLENLLALLTDMATQARRNTPILIIDDESDQATPDSSSDSQTNPSTINRLMRQIWEQITNGTYIGYTATPFANIFTNPDAAGDHQLGHLYPKDFVVALPTPSKYFGAEKIFGLSAFANEDKDFVGPDVIRHVPEEEMPLLAPKTSKDVELFEAQITESLAQAIGWFVVASAIRRVRGQFSKHSSMLIHTTHRVKPHFLMRDAINEHLEPLRRRARDGDVEYFHEIFENEYDRAPELYNGKSESVTWPKVSEQIQNVLRSVRLVVDNGESDEKDRLDYSGESAQTVIVIGGGTLSRGLTIEGLFVSFFTRTSNTYDTLLQMGRWFGFRNGYEDLQRIWLSSGLAEDYRFLATVESDLRTDIERMIDSGKTPEEIGVRVLYHPGRLQITSPNKMKHVKKVHATFDGHRDQTYVFDVETEAPQNSLTVEDLIAKTLLVVADPIQKRKGGAVLFKDIEFVSIEPFLRSFKNANKQQIFADAFKWVEEKLPHKKWNVVVASGSVKDESVKVGKFEVSPVRRAPIEDAGKANEINIRALMTGEDIIIDLRLGEELIGSSKEIGQDLYEVRKKIAEGKGLLVLYPISRNSKSGSNTGRISMNKALEKIKAGLSKEDSKKPIYGIGFVTPFDTENIVKNKGIYVAVKPAFADDEDLEEHETLDIEKDFAGDHIR